MILVTGGGRHRSITYPIYKLTFEFTAEGQIYTATSWTHEPEKLKDDLESEDKR